MSRGGVMDDRSLEVPATEYDGTTSDSFVPTERAVAPFSGAAPADLIAVGLGYVMQFGKIQPTKGEQKWMTGVGK
jgi:hypothetical protein